MSQKNILKSVKMKNSNILLVVLALVFFGFGMIVMQNSMPDKKEERIYNIITEYLPYVVEKRVGGFTIIFKDSDEKVKPSNEEFFAKIKSLDRFWAKTHLKLIDDEVTILDDKNQTIKTIKLQTDSEKIFMIEYFGLKGSK